jgi:hypothetical protein
MKCELCSYQTSPDLMPTLLQHLAVTCENPLAKEAQIVWRNSELTATLTVQEAPKSKKDKTSEIVFDVEVPEYEVPPVPPVAVPQPPAEFTMAPKVTDDEE